MLRTARKRVSKIRQQLTALQRDLPETLEVSDAIMDVDAAIERLREAIDSMEELCADS